ncbi:hypothetical protein PBR20603_04512 [Pandoraea bronchicola]|uniref:Uncharacterized protein n=1 Tax=Pandoraea bronchicola TaxID=2508287 RepID=A0A5E5BYN3_9BURK|nr:hypothetical protein PBR20603_04512 [Pandoraea bronchicola]
MLLVEFIHYGVLQMQRLYSLAKKTLFEMTTVLAVMAAVASVMALAILSALTF